MIPGPLPAGATASTTTASGTTTNAKSKSMFAFSSVWGMVRGLGFSHSRGTASAESSSTDNK
jgi:hypothetical protein